MRGKECSVFISFWVVCCITMVTATRKKKKKKHFGDFCRYISVNDQKRMLSMMKKEIKDRRVLCVVCVFVWKRKRDMTYSKKEKRKE